MNLWPKEFQSSTLPNGTVWELSFLLEEDQFSVDLNSAALRDHLRETRVESDDKISWMLTGNGIFFVKSFYNFLNDGGVRCPVARFFWRNTCPRKINLFNWLVWKNKVLFLENLMIRRCNMLPTATCVLCHSGIETVDYLFLRCSYIRRIWDYFSNLFQLHEPPLSMCNFWEGWRTLLRPLI